MSAKTVLLCGVGGQGTILAADLLARAALAAGFEVKVSEIHGMAQRGGAVTTVVRYGDKVNTMVADETIKPLPVACGFASMPADAHRKLEDAGAVLIPAHDLAVEAGNAKCENVAILGALESQLGFGLELWSKVIEGRVPPKTIESNVKAFELGFAFANERA